MVQNLKKLQKERIQLFNECAKIVYENMGYSVDDGYDFITATHPQEQAAFAIAVRVYNHIEDSNENVLQQLKAEIRSYLDMAEYSVKSPGKSITRLDIIKKLRKLSAVSRTVRRKLC